MDANYTLDYHKQCIDKLCRVCGNRAQKADERVKKVTPLLCSNNIDNIYIFYGIDIINEDLLDDVYPKKICKPIIK